MPCLSENYKGPTEEDIKKNYYTKVYAEFFSSELVPFLCEAIKLLRENKVSLPETLTKWSEVHDEDDAIGTDGISGSVFTKLSAEELKKRMEYFAQLIDKCRLKNIEF